MSAPVSFDWSDATGAASYELQIATSSAFAAPLVADQLVNLSQATLTGLPAQALWWRVRARNASGIPGANAALASVPASVLVAAGASSAGFAVSTHAVTSSTPVTLTAVQGATTRTAVLTLAPAASGTLGAPSLIAPAADARFAPGQSILFDWSDVAGAAGYTLQVDDANTFPAPLVLEVGSTVSQFATGSLPVKTMWFRVRANDAAGNPGTWSAIRRFEVKN